MEYLLIFWLLCALMLLVALAIVLGPILRPVKDSSVSPYDASVATHRQHMKNLEQQHQNGILDDQGLQQAREELEFALLNETQSADNDSAPQAVGPAKLTAVMLAIVIPLMSLGVYVWLGSYPILEILDNPQALQSLREQHPPSREDVVRQVNNLKRRIRQVPDDVEALDALANGQIALEEFSEAAIVLDQLIRQHGETAQRLVNYAEASSISNQMKFSPLAMERLERALELAPEHPKSLMMGAMAALQGGDKILALDRWQKLLVMLEPGSDPARLIAMLITRTEAGLKPGSSAPAVAKNPALPGPQIKVELSLAPALQDKISGQERVFVFARAVAGPPMPVAVQVLSVADLPASIILNDTTGMPSAPRLSSVDQVRVGARVSFSGSATPSPGDLEGLSNQLPTRNSPTLNLVIDRVRP